MRRAWKELNLRHTKMLGGMDACVLDTERDKKKGEKQFSITNKFNFHLLSFCGSKCQRGLTLCKMQPRTLFSFLSLISMAE